MNINFNMNMNMNMNMSMDRNMDTHELEGQRTQYSPEKADQGSLGWAIGIDEI
jgi:hypothetical protein